MDEACKDIADVLQLNISTMGQYAGRMQKVLFQRGEVLYHPEKMFDGIYVVVSGIAKVTLCSSDRELEVVAGIATRADVLGSDALHSPTFVTKAVAVTLLTVIKIPTSVMSELLRANDAFREIIHYKLGAAIAESLELIELLAKARSEARLAFFLLKVASKVSSAANPVDTFDIGLSREEIARYLGLTAATVSRRMTTLAEAGYVKVHGKQIWIENRTALQLVRDGKTIH